jgi:hypothetical protein
MDRPRLQLSVAGLLGVVACVALNVWLFRLGPLLGILGLNVTKHVVIAYLCQYLGVNEQLPAGKSPRAGRPATGDGPVAPARPFTSAP